MTQPSADPATDRRSATAVPPIAELRRLTQKKKTDGDKRLSYLAFRKVSIYITWALLHTRISANQVTVLSLVTAAGGVALLGSGPRWTVIVGLGLLLLYHLLDRVDGEIARYRGVYSIHGIYLDNMGHHLTTAGVLIATGYGLRNDVSSPTTLLLIAAAGGAAASLARLAKHAAFQLHSQYVIEDPGLAASLPDTEGALTRSAIRAGRTSPSSPSDVRGSMLGFAANVLLAWTQFTATVGLLLTAWIIDAIRGGTEISAAMLVAVSVLHIITYLLTETANLTQNLSSETRRLWQRDCQ